MTTNFIMILYPDPNFLETLIRIRQDPDPAGSKTLPTHDSFYKKYIHNYSLCIQENLYPTSPIACYNLSEKSAVELTRLRDVCKPSSETI